MPHTLSYKMYKIHIKFVKMSILDLFHKSEPYRVCRRVNILRDYPDDKIKIYP
jgi:hypothetical protein